MCDEMKQEYPVSLGVSSLIGTRREQQDSVYAEILSDSVVAIICDGMGGLASGALASQAAIQTFAEDYEKRDTGIEIPVFLRQEAHEMNHVVKNLMDENQKPARAGTTVAAVVIQKDKLYWLSVGDSRIYVIRSGVMMAVNRDHNYRLRLDCAIREGRITQEEYDKEAVRAEALISYLGIGNLTLMDVNKKPFSLRKDDIILVCSDGLYRTLNEEEVMSICREYLPDTQKVADMLTQTAVISSLENQDNTSVAVLHYVGQVKND